jgi:hypothetical protein
MEGKGDPDNRRDFAGNWPGDEDIFNHVRDLLHLREKTPALRHGALTNLAAGPDHYVYARSIASQTVVVALGKPPAVDAYGVTITKPGVHVLPPKRSSGL